MEVPPWLGIRDCEIEGWGFVFLSKTLVEGGDTGNIKYERRRLKVGLGSGFGTRDFPQPLRMGLDQVLG